MEEEILKYSVVIISSLAVTIVTLAFYIKHLHSKHSRDQNENLIKMTEAMIGNKSAIENHTRVNDELKVLIHSATQNILELKFKNGGKRTK